MPKNTGRTDYDVTNPLANPAGPGNPLGAQQSTSDTATQAVSKALHDAAHSISGNPFSELTPGNIANIPKGLPTSAPTGPQIALLQNSPWMQQIPGGPGTYSTGNAASLSPNKNDPKNKDKTPPPPTGTKTATTTTPAPDDVFTAGLGMFFNQYLQPMMAQVNSQNDNMINAYGQMMQQALGDLPPSMQGQMKAENAQSMQDLALLNKSSYVGAMATPQFNTLMNSMQMEGQGAQAIASALPAAIANYMVNTGNSQGLQSLMTQYGLQNSPWGAATAALLASPGGILGQLGLGNTGSSGSSNKSQSSSSSSTSTSGQQPAVQYIPIQTAPTAQSAAPAATASSNTSQLMNSVYAQMLANALQNPTAQQANATAASGYNPPQG